MRTSCLEGVDCRADCATRAACPMKVAATLLGDGRVVCVTPPALNNATASDYYLDVSLDGQSYTDGRIKYTYFQPQRLRVSQLDPAGGPGRGGTMVYVLGSGFESFGGPLVQATLAVQEASSRRHAREAEAAPGRVASGEDLGETGQGTFCLFQFDPVYRANMTMWAAATIHSAEHLSCEAPPFAGSFEYGFMPVAVHVLINGDGYARSMGHVNFTYYDDVEARIESIDTHGGPVDGGTWVRLSGRLFADYRRQGGDVPLPSELPPPRLPTWTQLGGLTIEGDVRSRYDGALAQGGAWTLQCRFGRAGQTDAVLAYEVDYRWDVEALQMHSHNYSGAWPRIPLGLDATRPTPVVWCQAPHLHGTGRAERVTLDLTLNGQDYVTHGAAPYLYYPRDDFALNCSGSYDRTDCNRGEAHSRASRYRGELNKTRTGRVCQRWDLQEPHTHSFTPERYPDAGLGSSRHPHNQCRAPGGLRNSRTWCYTTDATMRWDWCDIGEHPSRAYVFGGVRIEYIHPFGGPAVGGTLLTLVGRGFLRLASGTPTAAHPTGGALCNFGNATLGDTAAAWPQGGPARAVRPWAGNGSMPWHVAATIINGSYALCRTPVMDDAVNTSFSHVNVELTLNGQLNDLTHSGVIFQYYEQGLLSVRWIYPRAGPKAGGSEVTLYGTGFTSLGVPSDFGGWRGIKCLFGHLPPVEARVLYPIGAEAVRTALGDDPAIDTDAQPLAAAVVCRSPEWTNASVYDEYSPPVGEPTSQAVLDRAAMNRAISLETCDADGRAGCATDEAKTVCLEVTLNDDPWQHSRSCVEFTYYDL
eukprot:6909312-Prymnesium_polylepis.1